ncbi:MAG: glycosyltransferase, partial [Alphaproteobacteria bacterium]|nr:glycosyltransferase [Alphaproteobacteria bacterium]
MSFSSDFLSRPSIESGLRGKATADTNIAGPQTLEMFVPADDVAEPELTILVPALNEATTISRFLGWCKEGIARTGAHVEILIVDSSTDSTPDIALALGARVLRAPARGLGRAYIDATPFVRGKYVEAQKAGLVGPLYLDRSRPGSCSSHQGQWVLTASMAASPS